MDERDGERSCAARVSLDMADLWQGGHTVSVSERRAQERCSVILVDSHMSQHD